MGRGRRGGPDSQSADQESVLSDAHGHFSIVVPHPGAWTLAGNARGFRAQTYEQHEQFSTALVLSARSPEVQVNFVLKPAASLAGFVLDEAGDAVRSGQVVAERMQSPSVAGGPARWQPASFAQTDDRGHYELTGLADGQYRLAVTAHPWYASSGINSGGTRNNASGSSAAALDPSLDVVFPVTWYPGTDQVRAADTLTLQAGEDREADFHLQAVPAMHLSIPRPADSTDQDRANGAPRPFAGEVPQVTQLGAGGLPFTGGIGQARSVARDGTWDIGGLTPGTYEVRLANGGAGAGTTVAVTLSAGSSGSISLDRAVPLLRVELQVDGADPADLTSLTMTDLTTGQDYTQARRRGQFRGNPGWANSDAVDDEPPFLQVPPGDYLVKEGLSPGLTLAALSAKGAQTNGRVVHLADGNPVLTLRVQHARAQLQGVALQDGKPDAGAMVLLVPAGYGSAGDLSEIRRQQSASDGSFTFTNVASGPHLLVSLAHGWAVTWRDPATLARYLAQGVPLNLPESGRVQQQVTSVLP